MMWATRSPTQNYDSFPVGIENVAESPVGTGDNNFFALRLWFSVEDRNYSGVRADSLERCKFPDKNGLIVRIRTLHNLTELIVGSIPTPASSLNRPCGKDLGFFHTRVPAEVPAKNYPGSF